MNKPLEKPVSPYFSSGPCRKYPQFDFAKFNQRLFGRSHRSPEILAVLKDVIDLTREVHQIPDSHQIAIVPGSASGAIEIALWNFIGKRPVTTIVSDVFSRRWHQDLHERLGLTNIDVRTRMDGHLPDLSNINSESDLLMNWNGSTSGLRFLTQDLPKRTNGSLIIMDATSAVFTTHLPWATFDVTCFSWQKGLGSEAAHGILVLSPKAVEFLESTPPLRPLPYLFSLRLRGGFHEMLFREHTLNTPSLMCIEDVRQALLWAKSVGGIDTLAEKSFQNLVVLNELLDDQGPIRFLCPDLKRCSSSTICLKVYHKEEKLVSWEFIHAMADRLHKEQVAYDIVNHPGCPIPSLRIWGGPAVPKQDLAYLVPWLYWAYDQVTATGLR